MIAREYRSVVGVLVLVAVLVHIVAGTWPALPFWVAGGISLWLFRVPRYSGSIHPLGVVSPFDGRVTGVVAGHDPYHERPAVDLLLRMRWSGPYILYCPIEGQVVGCWDRWRDADGEKAGQAICIRTDEGDEVVLSLDARARFAMRFRVSVGERVGHGRPLGAMPFGGRARVLVGGHARATVAVGNSVRGGQSVIGEILHD